MNIRIKGTNIELTEAIKSYVTEKVESLVKFFDNIQHADADVGMRSHHHQSGKIFYAEIQLAVPGRLLRVEKDAEDLYKAIDKVRDHMKVELEQLKEELRAKDREEIRHQKEYDATVE